MGNYVCGKCIEGDSVADKLNRDQWAAGAVARRKRAAQHNDDAERYMLRAKIFETDPAQANHYRVKAHNCRVAAKQDIEQAEEWEASRDRYDWELANEQRVYPSEDRFVWCMVRVCNPCRYGCCPPP